MGSDFCCEKRTVNNSIQSFAPSNEQEIPPHKFISTNDSYFEEIESKYNVLTYINLIDYINLLENYTIETATLPFSGNIKTEYSGKDAFLSKQMSVDEFQSFIENKIFKHPVVIYKLNEISNTICKDNLLEIYKSLNKKLIQFDKENNNNNNNNNNRIKKYNILAFGVLFCNGKNISKIKNIFEIFKNKTTNNLEKNSNEFNDFILSLCLIPAYCTIYSRNKLNDNYNNELGDFNTELLKKILDASELKDSVNLCKIVIDKIYEGENVSYEKWENLFNDEENGIGFILCPKGIRNLLEKNNV
jgi:hypothetical protein